MTRAEKVEAWMVRRQWWVYSGCAVLGAVAAMWWSVKYG